MSWVKIIEIQPQVNYYNDLKCCLRLIDLMILGLGHFANAFYTILVILEYLTVTFDFQMPSNYFSKAKDFLYVFSQTTNLCKGQQYRYVGMISDAKYCNV